MLEAASSDHPLTCSVAAASEQQGGSQQGIWFVDHNNMNSTPMSMSAPPQSESAGDISTTPSESVNIDPRSFCSTPASTCSSWSRSDSPSPNKKRKLEEELRRKERNEREKARSNKISEQFDDLKKILVQAGVAVPKGTKGAILTCAMDYIKMLQLKMQHNDQ